MGQVVTFFAYSPPYGRKASAAAVRVAAPLRPNAYAPRPATSAASTEIVARPTSGAGAANLSVRRVGTAAW